MTINWFAPTSPAQSSPAFGTAALLPALARRARIVVWRHEPGWPLGLEEHAQVRRYAPDAIPWAEINSADATVYHLGNGVEDYGPILDVSRQHPGIVVLHELNLQRLFAGLALRTSFISKDDYLQLMEAHHPDNGRELGEAVMSGTRTADEICEECPLTGAAIENALGVVVHTPDGGARLADYKDLVVVYIPLSTPPITSPGIDEHDRAEAYAGELLPLIEAAIASLPQEAARWLAGRAGRAMKPWFSGKAARVLLPRVAGGIGSLVGQRVSGR